MSAIYNAYKPMRNYLRQCDLENSLIDVWNLSHYLKQINKGEKSIEYIHHHYSTQALPHLWELHVIAREVLINSTFRKGSKRLNSHDARRILLRSIRATNNEGTKLRINTPDDLFDEILRITHQQFPTQLNSTYKSLTRYLKVFGHPDIAPILVSVTGLTIGEIFLLGMALAGHLEHKFGINSDQDYKDFGISKEKSVAFFSRVSITRDRLKPLISNQLIDSTWEFKWSPLEAYPFINVDSKHPNRLYCPIPDLLVRRFSSGLYYDLKDDPQFGINFGKAYEDYVGELLCYAFKDTDTIVVNVEPYTVGRKNIRHGVDWIVSDKTSDLFIECKTKRLTQEARQVGHLLLRKDVEKISEAVVQNYKNILEAKKNLSTWRSNSNQAVPLVITFEDWFLFGPKLHQLLEDGVREKLVKSDLDENLITEMPYAVMSCREFELCIGAIKAVGIEIFFKGKLEEKYKHWLWKDYLRDMYKDIETINIFEAFEADWRKVMPSQAFN
ncbi:hypothetical protein [Comamonas terrigena]|uniref:hypothetical protein n=1 Tax=Comamonas terrigena TaxID=32013 RepID=UPI0028AC7F1C|nr:hypothetical protein [Comamonas terrigena]